MAEKDQKECFHVKRIRFFDRSVKIVMQNENGPCPLLSIANVLSLRSELKLPVGIREITQVRCLAYLLPPQLRDARGHAVAKSSN
jgi:hypothetical protein